MQGSRHHLLIEHGSDAWGMLINNTNEMLHEGEICAANMSCDVGGSPDSPSSFWLPSQ